MRLHQLRLHQTCKSTYMKKAFEAPYLGPPLGGVSWQRVFGIKQRRSAMQLRFDGFTLNKHLHRYGHHTTGLCPLCPQHPGQTESLPHALGGCGHELTHNMVCCRHGQSVHLIRNAAAAVHTHHLTFANAEGHPDTSCPRLPTYILPTSVPQPSKPDLLVLIPSYAPAGAGPSTVTTPAPQHMDKASSHIHIVEWFHTSDFRVADRAAAKSEQHLALKHALAREGWKKVTIHTVGISHSGVLHSTFRDMATALGISCTKAKSLATALAIHTVAANTRILRTRAQRKRQLIQQLPPPPRAAPPPPPPGGPTTPSPSSGHGRPL